MLGPDSSSYVLTFGPMYLLCRHLDPLGLILKGAIQASFFLATGNMRKAYNTVVA